MGNSGRILQESKLLCALQNSTGQNKVETHQTKKKKILHERKCQNKEPKRNSKLKENQTVMNILNQNLLYSYANTCYQSMRKIQLQERK